MINENNTTSMDASEIHTKIKCKTNELAITINE
jgi:hypothetical protein